MGYNNVYLMHTEPVLNPISHYENVMQISFEKFGADFSYLSLQSHASLMASGRLTGAVVCISSILAFATRLNKNKKRLQLGQESLRLYLIFGIVS